MLQRKITNMAVTYTPHPPTASLVRGGRRSMAACNTIVLLCHRQGPQMGQLQCRWASKSLVPPTTSTTQRQSLENNPVEGVRHQEVVAHSGNGLQNRIAIRSAGGGQAIDARVRIV
jgi:hypothetical protein